MSKTNVKNEYWINQSINRSIAQSINQSVNRRKTRSENSSTKNFLLITWSISKAKSKVLDRYLSPPEICRRVKNGAVKSWPRSELMRRFQHTTLAGPVAVDQLINPDWDDAAVKPQQMLILTFNDLRWLELSFQWILLWQNTRSGICFRQRTNDAKKRLSSENHEIRNELAQDSDADWRHG